MTGYPHPPINEILTFLKRYLKLQKKNNENQLKFDIKQPPPPPQKKKKNKKK